MVGDNSSWILLAHGSRDPEWCKPFEAIEENIKKLLPQKHISLAFMEFCEPTLDDTIDQHVSRFPGPLTIEIIPLFFATGRHLREDVPCMLEGKQKSIPDHVQLILREPIGSQPSFIHYVSQMLLSYDHTEPSSSS